MDNNGRRTRHLSHTEFYALCECVKTNRDGVSKTVSWAEATRFLQEKIKQEGKDFPLSDHSVQDACEAVGVALARRPQSKHRTREEFRDELEILARAVGRLYEKLGEPLTPGLQRLVEIARRERPVRSEES